MSVVTVEDWEQRKRFIGFGDDDIAILKALSPTIEKQVDAMVEELYDHFLSFPHLRKFLRDEEVVNRLKITQRAYFLDLFKGEYSGAYLDGRLKVGRVHQRIGLDIQWYMGAFVVYVSIIAPRIAKHYKDDAKKIATAMMALYRLINLDEELAIDTYIAAREEVIAEQAEEIMELSTPVVQVWDGVVAAPIIGTLDSQRTQLFMERLLETIVETKSPVALVDITGVPAIDTATAQHLIDTINAVKLLGAQVVITGVSPIIAQTLVHLGIDLSGIITRSSLAQGIAVALEILNLQIVPKGKGAN